MPSDQEAADREQMRIAKVEAVTIRCELGRTYRSTRMRRRYRDVVVTRIRTDQGAEGHCFNAVSGTSPADVANVILAEIAPAIVGVDLFAVEEVVKRAYRATSRYQRDLRISARGRACVDSAQWDALGKAVGQPLHRLWGGHSDPLSAIVWGGLVEEDRSLADYGHQMERIRKFGAMADAGPLELHPPELDPPYFQMLLNRPQLKDGYCTLPEGPG